MKASPALLCVALLAGCQHTPPPVYAPLGRPLRGNERIVRFESEPPGARVFVAYGHDEKAAKGREYIGQTPCEWVCEVEGDGRIKIPARLPVFSDFVQPVAVFTAERAGESRRQVFSGSTFWRGADAAPRALFFDFTKPSP